MNATQIRGAIDQVASWAYWIAALVVLGLFVLAVARHVGISISIGPKMSGMELLYLAGAAWLLKR